MPPSFNQFNDAALGAGYLSEAQKLGIMGSCVRTLACGALTYTAFNWKILLADPLELQSLEDLIWGGLYIENALGYGAALYFGLQTLRYLSLMLPRHRPEKWVQELKEEQRALLGLQPSAQKAAPSSAAKPQTPAVKPGAPAKPTTPKQTPSSLGPPLRTAKPITSPVTPQQQRGDSGAGLYGQASPASLGSGPRYSSRIVSTPDQLQRYMDSFEASTRGIASPDVGYAPYASPGYGYGASVTDASPLGYGTGAASMATPPGASVPTYRPSLQARGKAGSPHRGDGRLSPSSPETLEAVLQRLATGRRQLEVWTEQLRSWLAAELLQPLDRLAATAQKDVMKAMGDLGWTGMQLSALDAENGSGGSAASSGMGASSAAGGSAPEADEALLLAALREQLTQQLRQQPAGQQPEPRLMACLKAVNRYHAMAAVLRGERPRSLLPPTPRGYIACRLRELAAGPVAAAFAWNGGGSWGGKPWSPELPTDSSLLLYLFAAFLAAPKWEFPLEEPSSAQAGPLFLGALPPRPPAAFSAILSFRPTANALSKHSAAILELGMGSREPHFTLVLGGEPALTLCHHNALFHTILLFLQNAKLSGGGFIGNSSLDYLKLSAVLKPGEPLYSVFTGKWFGLW